MPGVDAEIASLTGGFVSKCFHHNLAGFFFSALVEKLNFCIFFFRSFRSIRGEKKETNSPEWKH